MGLGDIKVGRTLRFAFTTDVNGQPTQLAGSPAVSVYKDASTAQSASGVTLTVDFDSITGLNHVAIDTSADGTFYSAGSDFAVVTTTGTVGGVAVMGQTIGEFSIENRVVNWAQVVSPTTVVGLTGTTVKTATDVETDTADIQTRLPAALVGGRMDANTQAMAAGVIASTTFAASAIDSAAIAVDDIGSSELAASAANEIADATLARNVAGGSSTGRTVSEAVQMIRNKVAITGSNNPYTVTFYAEDDATPLTTAQLTFSGNTFGISTMDPA
jgi:hypothetical protein